MWLCDGTFRASPHGVRQLYVIHALLPSYHQTVPCVCTDAGKDNNFTKTVRVLKVLSQCRDISKGNFCPPDVILADFEDVVVSAVSVTMPATKHAFCLFHFAQILWLRAQMSGLQEAYAKREDVTLSKHFHMLIGLANLCILQTLVKPLITL